jgi:hypothetical protein
MPWSPRGFPSRSGGRPRGHLLPNLGPLRGRSSAELDGAPSLVTYLIPVVGVAAGVLVLGEPFSYRLLLGAVVISLGIALIQGRILSPRHPEPEPAAVPAHATRRGPSASETPAPCD